MPRIQRPEDVAGSVIRTMNERSRDPKWVWGIPWSKDFSRFNYLTSGIRPKTITFLVSRPSVGKSALAAKWAIDVAQWLEVHQPGRKVKIATFEMSAEAYFMRMVTMHSGVSSRIIESGFATPEQRQKVNAAARDLTRLPIEFLDNAASYGDVERFFRNNDDLGLGIIDHLRLVPGASGGQNSYAALTDVSQRLSRLAHTYAPLLVLTHQNRASVVSAGGKQGAQQDKRPTQESVAGSDGITQDADLILGLYREDMYVQSTPEEAMDPKPGELIILKHRHGPLGTTHLIYNPRLLDWRENPLMNPRRNPDEEQEKGQEKQDKGQDKGQDKSKRAAKSDDFFTEGG